MMPMTNAAAPKGTGLKKWLPDSKWLSFGVGGVISFISLKIASSIGIPLDQYIADISTVFGVEMYRDDGTVNEDAIMAVASFAVGAVISYIRSPRVQEVLDRVESSINNIPNFRDEIDKIRNNNK